MTPKEEKAKLRAERKAQFAAMTLGEKWQYFKDYYMKITIIAIIALVMLGGLIRDVVNGTRPCAFYALIVNSYTEVPDAFADDYIEYAKIDTKKYRMMFDATIKMNPTDESQMSTMYIQEIAAISSTQTQDVFLADDMIIDFFWKAKYIEDIRNMLPEEFLARYADQLYYQQDEDGSEIPVGIVVADSPRLKKYGMYEYQTAIVSVVFNAPDIENTMKFIDYLYTE